MPTKEKTEGMESINSINGVRFSLDDVSLDDIIKKGYKNTTDNMKTESEKNKEAFEREFNDEKILEKFAGACASIMCISTVTGIPLEDVFEMYVAEMKKDLESEDTKSIMEIGDDIIKLFNLLNGKEA